VSLRGSVRGPTRSRGGNYRRSGRPWWVRLIRTLVGLAAVILCLCLAAFGGLMAVTPSVGSAKALARAQDKLHHGAYPGPRIPKRFSAALEATEDHRFNEEPGIDPGAVLRFLGGPLTSKNDQGGATLYQQLAKLLYTPGETGVKVEAKQVALAVKLKYSYSGPEILRLYSDVAYFGNNFYGLRDASCGYYGIRPSRMSWPQAALMAGLVNGPTIDDPLTNPANARAREEHVIGRLVATGTLTQSQADRYLAVPLASLLASAGHGCRP
jgi:membrane peptidoglycan carboxypeptidase